MLVSFIVTSYNYSQYVLETIKSLKNQTINDFEIIVVDDCSTDDTEKTVKSIDDSRIKYIKLEKNSGACVARNKGIEISRGEFIAFNDSDDL